MIWFAKLIFCSLPEEMGQTALDSLLPDCKIVFYISPDY